MGLDHPRSRGVYTGEPGDLRSSIWIIPARAGFTGSYRSSSRRTRDHPRSRGVYRNDGAHPSFCWRIIPARAGFTLIPVHTAEMTGDHPRSRGVYVGQASLAHLSEGSSPLARGLRMTKSVGRIEAGIIPARAGFTSSAGPTGPWKADHPRSRGVYVQRELPIELIRGSSPLARGLRQVVPEFPERVGIIPARAGFTAPGRPSCRA